MFFFFGQFYPPVMRDMIIMLSPSFSGVFNPCSWSVKTPLTITAKFDFITLCCGLQTSKVNGLPYFSATSSKTSDNLASSFMLNSSWLVFEAFNQAEVVNFNFHFLNRQAIYVIEFRGTSYVFSMLSNFWICAAFEIVVVLLRNGRLKRCLSHEFAG